MYRCNSHLFYCKTSSKLIAKMTDAEVCIHETSTLYSFLINTEHKVTDGKIIIMPSVTLYATRILLSLKMDRLY
ncbi:MAG: hypothetical protein H6Q66_268 [Firmicutes bacterium]|nr:hypothetical protein [Bacillota bacterium]